MTPSETTVLTALRAFLLAVLPNGTEVVQSQVNRVPQPAGPSYVLFTPLDRNALATTRVTWPADDAAPEALDNQQSTELDVQLDVYGPDASDYAQTIATVFWTEYAAAKLGPSATPLYATDGHQAPLVNGEEQYENRWTMRLALQINPIVSTPQDFADTLRPSFKPVGGT